VQTLTMCYDASIADETLTFVNAHKKIS